MSAIFGWYLLLVLLPQLVWLLLSRSHGVSVFCDGCSLLPPHLSLKTKKSPDNGHTPQCHGDMQYRTDNLTARLCLCAIEMRSETDSDVIQTLMEADGLGGWYIPHYLPDLSGPCTIKRQRSSSLTLLQFLTEFAFTEPVILTGMSSQDEFRAHSTKYRLLRDYGQELITVATANTHSYRKVRMTLCDYVERVMKPQTYEGRGNETLYHFGDNDRARWDALFSLYHLPPLPLPNKEPVLSFGLAGPGSGVPFHVHGPTYAETIYGRKRWFLYPPSHSPPFDPDETTLRWFTNIYPSLPDEDKPMECTLNPDEILFIPDRWWHSTLNVDSVVFMSVFYS